MKKIGIVIFMLLLCMTGAKAQILLGKYQSLAFERGFSIQMGKPYAIYENKDTTGLEARIYVRTYCLDNGYYASIELTKHEAKKFIRQLKYYGEEFNNWKMRGEKNGFISNVRIVPEKFKANIYFTHYDAASGDTLLGRSLDREYYIEYFYNKTKKQARMFLRGGRANDERMGSDFHLSGWSIIFLDPTKEIQEIEDIIRKGL